MRWAAAMVLLAGCGGGAGPEETFAGVIRAREAKDWKTFYAGFAPESIDMLLYHWTAVAAILAGDDEAIMTELGEILGRHGAETREMNAVGEDQEKMKRAYRRGFADVRDRQALFVDLMGFTEKYAKRGNPILLLGERVQDVTVENDRATAAMVLKDGRSRELKFIKGEKGWKIDVRQ